MKNKGISFILLLAVLVLGCVSALGEAIGSPVAPKVEIMDVEQPDGKTLPAGFYLEPLEDEVIPEKQQAVLAEIAESTMKEEGIAEIITSIKEGPGIEQMDDVLKKRLEDFDVTKAVVTEFIPLTEGRYEEEIGDVEVQFAVPGDYRESNGMIALLGIMEENACKWYVLDVVGGDGSVKVIFTQEVLVAANGKESVLLFLRDDLPINETVM